MMWFILWYHRNFKIINENQAKYWGLTFYRNVYGDEALIRDCRSIYKDKKGRQYRVAQLNNQEKQ